MDDPGIDPAAHRQALTGLARINRVSGSARVLWPPIARLARAAPGRPVRVLDVATGAGDVPVSLWRAGQRSGFPIDVAGCDVSPTAVAAARARAEAAGVRVEFFEHDALRDPLPGGFDVVACSLFLHHLDEPDAVRLLREMGRAAGKLVLVNDLSRGPVNYLFVRLACRLLSRSPVVRFDGPASVRAAFTPDEARGLAEQAGLTGATVTPKFPCRFLLAWGKPA
jgi:2-polyprenyl-3-methyl-5-hydroxy-6-metoxy-1,4-benzoquinol methylase